MSIFDFFAEKGIGHTVAYQKAKARHKSVVDKLSKELPVGYDTTNPLHYLYKGMGFYGREREMEELEGFLTRRAPLYDLSLWAVTGPGGMGKSKLVYTFAERQKEAGWTVIYLNQERLRRLLERARQMEGDEADPFRLTEEEFKRDILLVADYANLLAKDLGELTELLFYNGPQDSDHSLEKLSEHGIMGKKQKDRSTIPWNASTTHLNSRQRLSSNSSKGSESLGKSPLRTT